MSARRRWRSGERVSAVHTGPRGRALGAARVNAAVAELACLDGRRPGVGEPHPLERVERQFGRVPLSGNRHCQTFSPVGSIRSCSPGVAGSVTSYALAFGLRSSKYVVVNRATRRFAEHGPVMVPPLWRHLQAWQLVSWSPHGPVWVQQGVTVRNALQRCKCLEMQGSGGFSVAKRNPLFQGEIPWGARGPEFESRRSDLRIVGDRSRSANHMLKLGTLHTRACAHRMSARPRTARTDAAARRFRSAQ